MSTIIFSSLRAAKTSASFGRGLSTQRPVRLPIGPNPSDAAWLAAQHDDAEGVTEAEQYDAMVLRTMDRAEYLAHQTALATARLVAVVGDAAPSYACWDRPTVCDCLDDAPCPCDGSGWTYGTDTLCPTCGEPSASSTEPCYLCERMAEADATIRAFPKLGTDDEGPSIGFATELLAAISDNDRVAAVDAADAAEDYCGTCGFPIGQPDGSCPDCRPKTGPGSRGGRVKAPTLHQKSRAAAKAKRAAAVKGGAA